MGDHLNTEILVPCQFEDSGQFEDPEDLENSLEVVLLTIGPSQIVMFVLQGHPEFYVLWATL